MNALARVGILTLLSGLTFGGFMLGCSGATDDTYVGDAGDRDDAPEHATDVNISCYGIPRESPLEFFEPDAGFLNDREAQAQLLDCLGQESAVVTYELTLQQEGDSTTVTYTVTMTRSGGVVSHEGEMVKDGKRIEFSLDDATARVEGTDAAAQEVSSNGENSLLDVFAIDAMTRLDLTQPGYIAGVVGMATGVQFELVGNVAPWTFTDDGDNVRATLANLTLEKTGGEVTAESIDLVLTSGNVPRETRMRFVGPDFESDFSMTID